MAVIQEEIEEQIEKASLYKALEKASDRWWYVASKIYTWKPLREKHTVDTIGSKKQLRSLGMQDTVDEALIM